MPIPQIAWPEGRKFAFTAFDDADYDRLHNVRPVYDFLQELGVFTTKSVWTMPEIRPSRLSGISTEDPAYLEWVTALQKSGFEIGCHGVRCHSSTREEIIEGLDRFRAQFGADPVSYSNHFQNADSVYWGAARLTGLHKWIYKIVNFRGAPFCAGHVPGNAHFWGDLCRERVRYVRNFVFREINTLAACPWMPYSDTAFPYVNAWYASAEGADIHSTNAMLCEANLDKLAAEGGACILYTHFAKGFYQDGKIDPTFERLMRRMASLGGWFVPVGTLLDYLAEKHGGIHPITSGERNDLQTRWLMSKLRHGSS